MNNAAVRGAVLVVVVILVGVWILADGLDDATIDPGDIPASTTTTSTSEPAASDGGATDDGATDDGATDGPADAGTDDSASGDDGTDTTTTTVPPATQVTSPPNEVDVLVLNSGSGVNGAAGTLTTQLAALGYTTLAAANGPEQTQSFIYYEPGFQADAEAIASQVPAPEGAVQPMPSPAPADPQGADILILIGPDSLAQAS